jgi:hypothetical protein
MDFVSDNLIFIVFVVIVLVSQVVRLLAGNAERRKREEGAEGRPEAAAYNACEDDAEDGDADEDRTFSAWALSVDAEADVPTVVVPVSPVAVPFPALPLSPVLSPFPFLALDEDSAAMRETGPSVGTRNKAWSATFPGKLDYLPPLKRAVVLSEILGPPKGI